MNELQDEVTEGKQQQVKGHQDASPLLAFLVALLLGAALQSAAFTQWVVAVIEFSLALALLFGALLGATTVAKTRT